MSSVTTAVGVQSSTQITQETTEYLTDRGLDIEVALSLGVYASSQYGTDCIALPYFKDGEVVNHKYKKLKSKGWDAKLDTASWRREGCLESQVLEDETLKDKSLIITEGEWDCIAAVQSGYVKSISVPDGAPSKV